MPPRLQATIFPPPGGFPIGSWRVLAGGLQLLATKGHTRPSWFGLPNLSAAAPASGNPAVRAAPRWARRAVPVVADASAQGDVAAAVVAVAAVDAVAMIVVVVVAAVVVVVVAAPRYARRATVNVVGALPAGAALEGPTAFAVMRVAPSACERLHCSAPRLPRRAAGWFVVGGHVVGAGGGDALGVVVWHLLLLVGPHATRRPCQVHAAVRHPWRLACHRRRCYRRAWAKERGNLAQRTATRLPRRGNQTPRFVPHRKKCRVAPCPVAVIQRGQWCVSTVCIAIVGSTLGCHGHPELELATMAFLGLGVPQIAAALHLVRARRRPVCNTRVAELAAPVVQVRHAV